MILDVVRIGASLLDKLIPDPIERAKAKASLLEMKQKGELTELEMQRDIIVAEAKGEGWMQRNWRPITMLTFVGLVVARWLGFTAPGISEQVEMELMRLIQMGLGGYVLGRSVEKGIKEWKK